MASVTDRIAKAVEALGKNQLKKALYLTDKQGMQKHHQWVEDASRTCLANRDSPEVCKQAVKEARDKLQDTITAPMDTTDLEGLEEYITPASAVKERTEKDMPDTNEMTDDEIYQSCQECHIGDAVVKFVKIGDQDCSGASALLTPLLEDEDTPPETWLKTMRQVAEKAECGKEAYEAVLGELEGYLEKQNSDILKKVNEEVKSG